MPDRIDRVLEICSETRERVAAIEERVKDVPLLWNNCKEMDRRIDKIEQEQASTKTKLAMAAGVTGALLMSALSWLKTHLFGG